jgi:glycosyltransferase involved in cell wall biosynthesis
MSDVKDPTSEGDAGIVPPKTSAPNASDGSSGAPGVRADGTPFVDRRRPREVRRPPNPRVTVVVPAKNEGENIREILPYLGEFHEVLVVVREDDVDSQDAARTALPSAKIVHQTRKGKGNALACGFAAATGDAIVTLDVDGSADPHEIPLFVKALTDGADLAKGSRFAAGGGSEDITLVRSLGNAGLNLLATVLTNTRFTDLCYGYNAFWADQLYILDLPEVDIKESLRMMQGDGFEIEALIIGRLALAGATITEVPSFEYHRYHGTTNLNTFKDGFRVLWTILKDRVYAREIRKLAKRRYASRVPVPRRPGWMKDPTVSLDRTVATKRPWQTNSEPPQIGVS